MKYIIGLFLACVGFALASKHLNQSILEYWDFVAFFVVIFGSLSVLIISLPGISMTLLVKIFARKFFLPSASNKKTAQTCLDFYRTREIKDHTSSIEIELLGDGIEMISLGFSKAKVQELLVQRFESHAKRLQLISSWLKRNAKYPPAFGLAGTVLGLIHLMRGVSNGIDTKETGIRMAVALVATFYGLLVSNLVLNPLGEWLTEEIKKDETKAEMAIDTVMAMMDMVGHVEFQEMINSYLEPSERIGYATELFVREAA